jgi:hypothetical protein
VVWGPCCPLPRMGHLCCGQLLFVAGQGHVSLWLGYSHMGVPLWWHHQESLNARTQDQTSSLLGTTTKGGSLVALQLG